VNGLDAEAVEQAVHNAIQGNSRTATRVAGMEEFNRAAGQLPTADNARVLKSVANFKFADAASSLWNGYRQAAVDAAKERIEQEAARALTNPTPPSRQISSSSFGRRARRLSRISWRVRLLSSLPQTPFARGAPSRVLSCPATTALRSAIRALQPSGSL
jgi:hypothetical protein